MAGCANPPSPPPQRPPDRVVTASPSGAKEAYSTECVRELTPLVASMEHLLADDSSLATYQITVEEIGEAFDAADFDDFDDACIAGAATPVAEALAKYQEAEAQWLECVEAETCSQDVPSSAVEDTWVEADWAVRRALAALSTSD